MSSFNHTHEDTNWEFQPRNRDEEWEDLRRQDREHAERQRAESRQRRAVEFHNGTIPPR